METEIPTPSQAALAERIICGIEGLLREWLMNGEHAEGVALVNVILTEHLTQLAEANGKALAHYSKLADEHANQADLLNMQLAQSQAREERLAALLAEFIRISMESHNSDEAMESLMELHDRVIPALARHQAATEGKL